MEEDMNDIDIIDRYLNDELTEAEQKQFKERYLTDAAFKNEVEVYRKIYQGVELGGNKELKKRLNTYYNEYIAEQDDDDNIRPINWRRRIYVITAIAASLCLFALAYWGYYVANPPGGYAGAKPKKPLNGTKPGTPPKPKDVYALTGQTQLPDTAIRQANYPQPLSYTFNRGLLTIYGNPLLAQLDLALFKKDGQYYLKNNDSAYLIIQTQAIKLLVKQTSQIKDAGIPSTENIQVQLAPLKTDAYSQPPIGVVISADKGANQYFFTKQNGKTVLVLQGGFDPANCTVINLKKDGVTNWYVLSAAHIYLIDPSVETATPLKELSGLSDPVAQLFDKKVAVTKPVLVAVN